MSEPTYRIETSHDPQYAALQWFAFVYRMSDDVRVYSVHDVDEETVIVQAQAYIARVAQGTEPSRTLYANESGEIVPAPEPQSLRA